MHLPRQFRTRSWKLVFNAAWALSDNMPSSQERGNKADKARSELREPPPGTDQPPKPPNSKKS
eukprot:5356959-Amphidinium_carterae.1